MATGLELKINVRHSNTGNHIRTVTRFNNFRYSHVFNSIASTWSFDYYFDPNNQEDAEVVCVSHMHECQWYYNGKLFHTGYILNQNFRDTGKPEWVKISGYSKTGVLGRCDTDADESLETNGLSLRQIVTKFVRPFNSNGINVVFKSGNVDAAFQSTSSGEQSFDEDTDEKAAKKTSQNIASYLSDLCRYRGVVMSHDEKGNLVIARVNTKQTPILNLDYSDSTSDAFKIPGLELNFSFNGDALHTKITVVQQADEESGTNASQFTRRNPLIPIKESVIYRPKTVIVDFGNQFTMQQACDYEMGLEVREAAKLEIDLGTASLNGALIKPGTILTVKNRNIFAYKNITWFIESVETNVTGKEETAKLNCVLPFGYDFNYDNLSNVWVDPHENLPIF